MAIKLSICIPTYNRAKFIGAALESIVSQYSHEIEVVISDNASTDNTEEIVLSYQKRFERIRYVKLVENLGADRNFLNVIDLASGSYCWLLGSDDAIAPESISKIIPLLGKADVYLIDRINSSFNTNERPDSKESMLNAPAGKTFDCSRREELLEYFYAAKNIGSLFSFISAIIVNRKIWQSQPIVNELIGSNWIHVSKVFQMMKGGARINYIGQPLVINRTGNDSFFQSAGYTNRRLIDLDFPRVARKVFTNDPEIQNIVTSIVAERYFDLRVILSDKRSGILSDGPDAGKKLEFIYKQEFSNVPHYKIKIFLFRNAPLKLLSLLKKLDEIFAEISK